MKFDKKEENINSYNSGLMKKGGVGPKGTAMSHMWGGESVEMQDQGFSMGGNRDFLKGPGSRNKQSESTFSGNHSGIVKAGMDSGMYKVGSDSGMHKAGEDSGFYVIDTPDMEYDPAAEEVVKQDLKNDPVDNAQDPLAGLENSGTTEDGEGEDEDDDEKKKKLLQAAKMLATGGLG